MALHTCIPDLVARGAIPEDRAADITRLYDELVLQYESRFGREAAEAMATQRTLETLEVDALEKKRTMLLQMKRQQSIMDNARHSYDGGKAGKPTGDAMMAHLVRDEAAPYANVEYRWKKIKQDALGAMYGILQQHRAGVLGQVRNKSEMALLVRELHGEKTGDLNSAELADAWRKASGMLRQRFNAAGGKIGELDDWGMPHSHDSLAVGSVGAEAWIDEVIPRLDRLRMVDDSTGLPFSDQKLRLVMRDVYESIVSEGWSKRSPGAMGQKSVGNRHAEHRFLHFKSADDWMSYNDRFGNSDPLSAMMAHVDLMARDTAMMEILGPNPAATIQWMKDIVAKDAYTSVVGKAVSATGDAVRTWLFGSERMRALNGLPSMETAIDRVFAEVTGANKRGGNRSLALFGSSIRNWQTSTKLGGAAVTSLSDVSTQALTRAYNGLPVMNVIAGYAKQLNPLDAADRDFSRRLGIIGDEYAGRALHGGRMHLDEVFGMGLHKDNGALPNALEASAEITRRAADATLRASGLNALTNAGRETMGMEFMNAIVSFSDIKFAELSAPFRNFLTRYGVGEAGWDSIRATPKTEYKGAQWIIPDTIADKGLADRLMEGVLNEIDFAVPTGGLRQRAAVNSLPPGSILGEILRTGFQFKMFPLTVIHMHGARMMAQSALHKKAIYGAAFLGVTTLTGIFTTQVAEVTKGRDPLSLLDAEGNLNADLIKKGMLKGGGFGIYGDILNNATSEYGQDIGDIIVGPGWSTIDNLADLAQDGDAASFMQQETPGGSIWYLRAAYERMVVDTVADWQDGDKAADRYQRLMQRAEDNGQGYYWEPGSGMTPQRAPDFGNAFGEVGQAGEADVEWAQ